MKHERLPNEGFFNFIALVFYRPSQHFWTNLLKDKRRKSPLYGELRHLLLDICWGARFRPGWTCLHLVLSGAPRWASPRSRHHRPVGQARVQLDKRGNGTFVLSPGTSFLFLFRRRG